MIATATTSGQHTLILDRESFREWKVTMRTSNTRARKFRSTVGRIVMALVVASMIGGISVAPAFARDDDRGRGRHEARGHYRGHEPRDYYREPVYAPPPVYYAPTPYQSPGINLVFPIRIR
jgi:hypothetical protein